MTSTLPIVHLAGHGETAWTVSGQHTGSTDLPLTPHGERNARSVRQRLLRIGCAKVCHSLPEPVIRLWDDPRHVGA